MLKLWELKGKSTLFLGYLHFIESATTILDISFQHLLTSSGFP